MNVTCLGFYDKELLLIAVLVVWELIWKAIALYKAWKKGDKLRFVLIFILNTCGLLSMIYIFLWDRKKNKKN